jgi:hypothetical protein
MEELLSIWSLYIVLWFKLPCMLLVHWRWGLYSTKSHWFTCDIFLIKARQIWTFLPSTTKENNIMSVKVFQICSSNQVSSPNDSSDHQFAQPMVGCTFFLVHISSNSTFWGLWLQMCDFGTYHILIKNFWYILILLCGNLQLH